MMEQENAPLLKIENMYKEFAGNQVLKGVSLVLQKCEVHAIVGGNGAGKSTLMKIITGLYKAEKGTMIIKGEKVSFSNTHEAHVKGVYLVPQEPLIFPNMSVEENIIIGLPGKKAKLKAKVVEITNRLGWKFDFNRSALTLSIAEQQLVEIIRGLVREAEILILDEPTSTLTFGEITSLFKTIKQLTSEGLGLFYITHRFNEIFQLANTVSVLRDGVISAQGPVIEFNYERLLEGLMPENTITNEPSISEDKQIHQTLLFENPANHPTLIIENLSGKRFKNINFTLKSGEILGIAGVVGAGRTELAEAIFGLRPVNEGTIQLNGKEINRLPIRKRISQGIVYVPEDRHSHGIFSITSIQKNISSTILDRLNGLILPIQQEKNIALEYTSKLNIKATSIQQELKDLSGGNQQKVVLAKYLASIPKVIIFDEPTRGIDASARKDIYLMIESLKKSGLAVLLISSDMEEIELLSDRVMVMHEGHIVKTLIKPEISLDRITSLAFGVKKEVI